MPNACAATVFSVINIDVLLPSPYATQLAGVGIINVERLRVLLRVLEHEHWLIEYMPDLAHMSTSSCAARLTSWVWALLLRQIPHVMHSLLVVTRVIACELHLVT